MQEILWFSTLLIFGHYFGAIGLYLTHRFIFHGKVEKIKPLAKLKKLHTLHHKHFDDEKLYQYIYVPIWGRISLTAALAIVGALVNVPFAIGLGSFAFLYMKRHMDIHTIDKESRFHKHHNLHHKNARVNFSGIYPWIDSLFGTKKQSIEAK